MTNANNAKQQHKEQTMPSPKIDLFVYDHGSVWTIEAASRRAGAWVRDNVGIESWAGTAKRFTGDWRPMRDIVEGAVADGLVVSGH